MKSKIRRILDITARAGESTFVLNQNNIHELSVESNVVFKNENEYGNEEFCIISMYYENTHCELRCISNPVLKIDGLIPVNNLKQS